MTDTNEVKPVRNFNVNGRLVPETEIKGLECIFATYSENKALGSDVLVIKENVHFNDGRVEPNIRIRKDMKWPYYVTKEGFRNHEDKKEWEDVSRLQRFTSTRSQLARNIAKSLNYGMVLPLRSLGNSPYLYGTDISPTALIKDLYRKTWPDVKTMSHNVAALDTETDVVGGTGEVIIANITLQNKSYTTVTTKFIEDTPDFIERCRKKAEELMGDDLRKRNLEWEIEIVDTPGQACAKVIEKAHEWRPDFISIWNMNYDIPVMKAALEKEGYDTALVFSDPNVPKDYRFFTYREGNAVKVTQSGAQLSLHPAERWHVCTCPASFYFLDSMCLYKRIRVAAGNESSYALDYILKRNKLDSKLKIKELEHLEEDGDKWHYAMQKDFKAEYVVYNLRDDLALLDLDEKTGDIARAFPALAGISDYSNFNKNPRRIVDDLHFFVQERGKVIAATPDDISKDPLNKHVLGMNDWIITLPSFTIDSGSYMFEDAPEIKSMVYRYLADLDISSTYPNAEDVLNISKETTAYETCKFNGFTEAEQRYFSLTLTTGKSSALELGVRYLNMPSPQQLLEQFDKDHAIESTVKEVTTIEEVI